jgi:hypothetical protein
VNGRRILVLLLVLAACAGCSKAEKKAAPQLTERQRDSILSTEPIPGADVIGRAMQVTDREAKRATDMDSLTH